VQPSTNKIIQWKNSARIIKNVEKSEKPKKQKLYVNMCSYGARKKFDEKDFLKTYDN